MGRRCEVAAVEHTEDRISPIDAVVGSNLKPSNEPVEGMPIHAHGPRPSFGEQHTNRTVLGVEVLGSRFQSLVEPLIERGW